jgi:hypothetical protein
MYCPSGVTPTSGVGDLNVYLVSGVLDYNVTITETFNQYTSGAVKWEVSLIPTDKYDGSGLVSGAIPIGFVHSSVNYLRAADGSARLDKGNFIGPDSGVTNVAFNLDTSGLENGTYELVFDLEDYAGNTNKVVYVLYINNPLQYVDVTLSNEASGIISLNFSSTIVQSGANSLLNTDFEMVITRSGGTQISTSDKLILVSINPRSIIMRVSVNEGADQFKFEIDDDIRVEIKASGIAKLFNTLDAPIIETTGNRRTLFDWPSNMAE